MMFHLRLAATILILASSPSVYSMEDIERETWQEQPYVVKLEGKKDRCLGTILGKSKVLTSTTCLLKYTDKYTGEDIWSDIDTVKLSSGQTYRFERSSVSFDDRYAVISLNTILANSRIVKVKKLSSSSFEKGKIVTTFGFKEDSILTNISLVQDKNNLGGGHSHPNMISSEYQSNAQLTSSDAGGAWIDEDTQELFAFTQHPNHPQPIGLDLHYARLFLLESINGWNYPTSVTGSEKITIEVQSLHINPTMDSAYIEGGASIITNESSCFNKVINAFDTCTYVIRNENEDSILHLSNSEEISITYQPNVSKNSSGGSFGFYSLLLIALAMLRKIQH